MIEYDPKRWFFDLFSIHGTVLPRVYRRVLLFGSMALALWAWDVSLPPLPALDPLAHQIIGVALGLLIVLRTNASFDRWWEGRKLWGGLVNSSRNLLRSATAYVGPADELAQLVAAYAAALKQHLRGRRDLTELEGRVPDELLLRASSAANPPLVLSAAITAWVQTRFAEGKVDSILARHLDARVTEMIDYQGACERILRTPIPFAYAVHIKQLLLIYVASLPFALVPKMDLIAVPVVMVIAFGMLGIEEAGVEIEDPFGDDPNDLPLEDICAVIARDTAALAELAKK